MTEKQMQELLDKMTMLDDTFGMIEEHLCNIRDSLQRLRQCVDYIPPTLSQREGYHILRIGGSVDTDNY